MKEELEPILYIDDEVENLRGFQFLFKRYYQIHVAKTAEEGLELLKNHSIKLILADQRMPGMTGVDFFEIAAELYPAIIRIILTGYSDIEAIIKAINKGKIFKYVTKPWDKDELKLIIDNALWSFNISAENRILIENLKDANQNLEQKVKERTNEILKQKREIEEQRDLAKHQRDQIAIQNEELEKHRTHLEFLVQERTIDLIAAKEKAEQSDKLKSAFLANFSHEIRTPMNAVMGFSYLLKHEDRTEAEKNEFVDIIISSSQYLLNLINEIIDISRIEAGELTLDIKPTNLCQIVTGIITQYEEQKALMNKTHIKLLLNPEFKNSHLSVNTDPIKLHQILVNLLENALKFTEEGSIEFGFAIKQYEGKNFIVIHVQDTGIGINEDAKGFIFERFRKVENAGADKLYRGAGLGLAISKRLVELLGGNIWVDSELNKGSVFYFTLPYDKDERSIEYITEKKSDKRAETYNWTDKIILVAEDEPTNFKYIANVLRRTSIHLLWAKNGLETCEYLRKREDIDLVLMDIRMPIMDGYEATKRIKAINRNIPIIAQTAYALEYEKEEILKAGCDDYIAKPYSDSELLKMINRYFA
jgi:signal transduction histidine kinase